MPKGLTWTEHEDAELIQTYLTGVKMYEVAVRINRSLDAVYCRLNALRKEGVITARARAVRGAQRANRLERLRRLVQSKCA